MFKHLLLAVTAGFGVGERAKGMLEGYPPLRELVEVEAVSEEGGRNYLLKLWEGIQKAFNLWDVTLKIGGDCLCYRMNGGKKEILFPKKYLEGQRDLIKAFLFHEVSHALGVNNEVIATLVELAATDTLFERERDVEILLPLILPFMDRVEPTGSVDSYFVTKHEVGDRERVRMAFHLMLLAITKEGHYRCGSIVGEPCLGMIVEALTEAYMSALREEDFLKAFEERILNYLEELEGSKSLKPEPR